MSRWEHTVYVRADAKGFPYLRCACGWINSGIWEPTVSRLAEIAQDHRRAANKSSSP